MVKKRKYWCIKHCVLLRTTEEDTFKRNLNQVIRDLCEDPDTKAFAEYFIRNYVHRPEVWAYCNRMRLGINTNMYLESFHKTLRHFYLEGKKVKELMEQLMLC